MTTQTETHSFLYKPRPQFELFHQRHQRDALMVCHRRFGKTVGCVGDLIVRALHTDRKNSRYAYVAPYRQQAKEIAWTYLKDMTDGLRSEKPRESELRVKLKNGAWITLYGADNPDNLRGMYFDGLVLDEFGDMKPSLMGEVILPCLADRNGFLVIIGTPKGRNQFYDYMKKARDSDKWFYQMLKASETGVLSEDELQRLRDTMSEEQYQQEMECDFDAALLGTFYADMINKIAAQGQIQSFDDEPLYNPEQKVHVAADVGLRDSTAWWFWQPRPDGVAVIDYYEAAGKHVDHYLHMLYDKGYEYHEIWLPHDAKAKTLATRRSTVEQLRVPNQTALDYRDDTLAKKYPGDVVLPIRITPKLSIQHGIDSSRKLIPRCYFDGDKCAQGLDALRSYRRQYHEHSQTFSDTPLHDWASNGSDAFRYMALVADSSVGRPTENPPRGFDSLDLGGRGATVGYQLDDLWKDRENGRRSGIIRI